METEKENVDGEVFEKGKTDGEVFPAYGKKILICEDTLEGLFTAVYDGWIWASRGLEVKICTGEPEYPELFATSMHVPSESLKARKVARSVRKKLGVQVYESVCFACASAHPDKGTAVFYVLRRALEHGRQDTRVMEALADPAVSLVSSLQVKVWHELHRYYGFVRFRETGGGVLFARIAPENDILELLAPHFADRFPRENWMIYDEKRGKVLTHPKGKSCTVYAQVSLSEEESEALAQSDEYEDLWQTFCKCLAIEERRNPRLQRQFVPLKFRSNMTEFV